MVIRFGEASPGQGGVDSTAETGRMSGHTTNSIAPVIRKLCIALIACCTCTLLTVFAGSTASYPGIAAAAATPASSPDPSQRELNEAQTAYYRAQIEELQHKNEWGSLVRDQLGGLIAGITGFVAAVIAFLTFVTNFSSTTRNERDTQFFEALKRFGDKDSTTSRASGAGLLGIIGATNLPRFLWWFPDRPYVQMAFEQLIAGLRLETDGGVIAAIRDAAQRLVALMSTSDRSRLTELIGDAPLHEFNGGLAEALGRYMAFASALDQATAITGVPKPLLEKLTHDPAYQAGFVEGDAFKNDPHYIGTERSAQSSLMREIARIKALQSIQGAASKSGLLVVTPASS